MNSSLFQLMCGGGLPIAHEVRGLAGHENGGKKVMIRNLNTDLGDAVGSQGSR